jgi:two-component system, cell cycle sensor histidine kinase and response regulator CckA
MTRSEGEELFRVITEHASDLIAVLDLNGRRLYNSPSYTSIFADTDALPGTDSFLNIHPGDRERIQEIFRKTVNDGIGRRADFRLITSDGRVRYIESQGDLVRDEEGKPQKVVVVSRDVTEQRESERQMRLLAQSLTSTRDCFVLADLESRILFVNPSFMETCGYSDEELIGTNLWGLLSPNNPPELIKQILPVTIAGGWNGELVNRRKDGSEFPVELWTSPVSDESDIPVAIIAVTRDITERKLAEKARNTLESQLRQAQKLESIGTLAGGIAHDFNNILAIVSGYASLIARGRIGQEGLSGSIDGINRAARRGAELVRQLLTFASRTESDQQSIDINDTVEELLSMIQATFPGSITISAHLDDTLPRINGDPSQIYQALLNLCVNARDAMPQGGTLTVTTDTLDGAIIKRRFADARPETYVHVAVSDTGVGMDKEVLDRVFEPFFTTKARDKGTGLGLAVVFGVARSHQAFVDVESVPQKGSTFNLFFPLSRVAEMPQPSMAEISGDEPGGNETILLVEDEESLLHLVGMFLVGKGYRVLSAGDGESAVKMLQSHKEQVSLVFMDIDLPRLNGWDAYLKMKEINPSLRAILTSGYRLSVSQEEMTKEGVRVFLPKPYSPAEVFKRIRKELDFEPHTTTTRAR